jgi:phosphoglucosamine mutase
MAVLALALRERGVLAADTARHHGDEQPRPAAGDGAARRRDRADRGRRPYVLEEMRRGGYSLGGEQSGHVLMLDHATTGDGVLTALHCSPGSRRPAPAGRPGRGDGAAAAGAGERAGVDKSLAATDAEVAAAVLAAESSSARPAASCSVPPAPSRWSG